MQHPLELIQIARESKFKKQERKAFLPYVEKDKIQPYIQKVEKLSQEYLNIKEIVNILHEEYQAEMNHRKKLKELWGN